jgi:hypothetical protein
MTSLRTLSFVIAAACVACGTTASGGGGTFVADTGSGAKDAADAAQGEDVPGEDVQATDSTAGSDVATVDAAPSNLVAPGDLAGTLNDGDQLQGDYTLTGALTIPQGAVVTFLAGTTITSPSFGIAVKGDLTLLGTQATPVVISGPLTGKAWAGIHVAGSLTASWFDVSGATINIQSDNAALLTLDHGHSHHAQQYNILSRGESNFSRLEVDSPRAASDATYNIGVSGGTMTLEDSNLHDTPNECIVSQGNCTLFVRYNLLDTGHCGIHFNATKSAEVLHNEFKGNLYGMMVFGVAQAEVHGNNFSESSQLEIAANSAQTAAVNFTGNYWDDKKNFQLGGAQLDSSGELSAPATDVGPRPE